MTYKGFYVWFNGLQGWHVQKGYAVLYTGPTIKAAKQWITREIKKDA